MSGAGGLLRALVLHRRDYGNTSLLVELFAQGQGRFPAIAKGARRGRRPTSALLQPFQPLWVGVVGRGEVLTLTRVEAAARPFDLGGPALPCAFYLNELLMRLLGRHDPQAPIFAFYHAALGELAAGAHLDSVLRQFELRLLEGLGYAPSLDLVVDGGTPVAPDRHYLVEPGRGTRAAPAAAAGERVSGATLLALARGEALAPAQAREARALFRRLLQPHLGPKPLKSRELFRQWRGGRQE
ncbi:DNA repair protein RecO [uncultured Thiodictyon sp.]|uniref:DNA repair protein RecO n=1 Tax=uncultured Thiodictyon sp. TaxID=1846217 RepID=UPI0025E353CD|nr:DNA repair protein RecO [uncultured Thiodictyon sp.]